LVIWFALTSSVPVIERFRSATSATALAPVTFRVAPADTEIVPVWITQISGPELWVMIPPLQVPMLSVEIETLSGTSNDGVAARLLHTVGANLGTTALADRHNPLDMSQSLLEHC